MVIFGSFVNGFASVNINSIMAEALFLTNRKTQSGQSKNTKKSRE